MWEVCGCQSRACGDDSVKHLRVRSLPCRNPSSSFAACADFLLLILNSCRFSCLNTVVYASCCASGYGMRLMFLSWFILQSAAKIFIIAVVKKPNDCSLCDWLIDWCFYYIQHILRFSIVLWSKMRMHLHIMHINPCINGLKLLVFGLLTLKFSFAEPLHCLWWDFFFIRKKRNPPQKKVL